VKEIVELNVPAVFTGDSKRYHRFQLVSEAEGEIVGTIYLQKDSELPKTVSVELISKAHKDYAKLSATLLAKKGG